MEHIEEKNDLEIFDEALTEYQINPVSYSLDEVERELGLKWNTKRTVGDACPYNSK